MIACRTGVSSGNFVWYCQAAGSMTCASRQFHFLGGFDMFWPVLSYPDRPCLRLVVVDNAFACKRKCATMPLIKPYPDIVTVWSLLPCGPLSSQGSQAFWHRQLSNVSDRFRSFQIVSGCSGRIYVGRMLGGVAGYGSDGLKNHPAVAAASILSQFQTPERYHYLTLPWYRWPIAIDGLPINSMVIFHGYVK